MGFDPHNGGNILVGLDGTAAVTQAGASIVHMDHDLVLGVNAGGSGTYTLGARSLTGGNPANLAIGSDLDIGGFKAATDIYGYDPQTVAAGDTGTLTQNSGDMLVISSANVGSSGGAGTFNQTGGTMTVDNQLFIGNNGGTGAVVQTGGITTVGSVAVDGALALGTSGGSGSYSITGNSTLIVNGSANIGQDSSASASSMTIGNGIGTPVVTIQSQNCNGNLVVGGIDQDNLTFNSGKLTVQGITHVCHFGTGTVVQNGGSFESGYLDIGIINTNGNSYTLNHGAVIVDNDLVIGNFAGSGGTFRQAGDTVNVNSPDFGVYINNGTYNLQSGNFNVVNIVTVGDVAGGASVVQGGGGAAIGNTLIFGNSAGTTGLYSQGCSTLIKFLCMPGCDPGRAPRARVRSRHW